MKYNCKAKMPKRRLTEPVMNNKECFGTDSGRYTKPMGEGSPNGNGRFAKSHGTFREGSKSSGRYSKAMRHYKELGE